MTKNELRIMQGLPLEIKEQKSLLRIREYVEKYGEENIFISFSGGKDSTVLLHLVRRLYPEIKAVFSNTGLEFPELVAFAMSLEHVEMVRPEMTFRQVLEKYGYPVVSKQIAMMIYRINSPADKNVHCRNLYLHGYKQDGTPGSRSSVLSEKWRYLLDAPFKISHMCCKKLKIEPLQKYAKRHNMFPFVGVLASESSNREKEYIKTGCNSFKKGAEQSKPLGFWTEQDILAYIDKYNLEIASVYGNVVKDDNGKFKTTGEQRTGCIYCCFGIQYEMAEQGETRFQRLERTHPQLHNYCINKLGLKEVLEYMDIPYTNKEEN